MSGNPVDLYKLLDDFTQGGTPLQATMGSKQEWGTTILAAGMLANHNLAATMTAEEMADAAISYFNVLQERLALYNKSTVHSLENLL